MHNPVTFQKTTSTTAAVGADGDSVRNTEIHGSHMSIRTLPVSVYLNTCLLFYVGVLVNKKQNSNSFLPVKFIVGCAV